MNKRIVTIISIIFFNSLKAQPFANPNMGGEFLSEWLGGMVAALIIGGIFYFILRWIGDKISDWTNKDFYKVFFKILGIILWVTIFIVFVFFL